MSLGLPLPASGSAAYSIAFGAALLITVALKLWLASRQCRHVARHRSVVPAAFIDRIPLYAHQRAADYTLARARLHMIDTVLDAAIRIGLTLLGGMALLVDGLRALLPASPFLQEVLLVVLVLGLIGVLELPVAWYRQFVLERRFGFNRMTPGLFFMDLLKSSLLSLILGMPVLCAVLWLMTQGGPLWWLWAWAVWMAFVLLLMWVYPTLLAPLFNRFTPLDAGAVRERVESLLDRCGFASRGVFVMDGSRRSAHGNAYFTGLGRAKRIVFFDTLLARLDVDEIEAVLAHELGHFKLRHVRKRLALSAASSLIGLALLAWLMQQPGFFQGLGVTPHPEDARGAIALLLYGLTLPTFSFLLTPVSSGLSRRQEFEADAFAARHTPPERLGQALIKLYEDNASTLTPDPLHSAFYDSHPPALRRLARLRVRGELPQADPAFGA